MRRALLAAAVLASSCEPAFAQAVCGKRDDLLRQLGGRWQERPVAMGLTDTGSVMKITAAADGATWSALVTHPNGVACVVATGERWETVPAVSLGPDL